MKRIAIAFALSAALAGCATNSPLVAGDLRTPPESAMQECKPLSDYHGKTAADLVNKTSDWAREHNVECLLPHHELIEWVKGNKK